MFVGNVYVKIRFLNFYLIVVLFVGMFVVLKLKNEFV